ncbi:tetratricopeptide repeat protein [Streptomyces sp. NBC_00102]|uniref:tetratricopeptide repeat protein n=1 Tax=Streptomyces sp. NBC_00102 TaxID=2975652 RepID=UPI00224EB0DE|nr:tetratricopeptide repeat protein [Streptomyces sp. NBC_00102]MCX5397660.1 tetratricopeptide repeat protein [Streptomyces sp. NBC_00102]
MKRKPPTGPDTPQAPPVTARAGSNAAGRDILNSVALHVENATLPPAEAYGPIPSDAAAGGLSNLPRGALFVGRSAELDALDTAFEAPGGVVLRAVSGLGGVGKSALAAHWAARRCTARLRWWIGADSPAGVEAGLAGLARALQPGLTGLPQELQRERALAWLAAHDDWLLVLDNVNLPDDVRPLLDRLGGGGRVLVTTRLATGWHHLTATTVRLGVFAPAESVELFCRVLTQTGPRDTDGAAEVCEELGHLALAVEQAAAYCHENGTTPRAYLAMLRSWPAETYATGAETTDADRTVARVWRITLDRLADTPLPGDVLRTLAWYAPDRITRDLLDDLAPPPVLAKAIGRLVAHSMITAGADGTLSVHRLVQALARTSDPDDPHRAADAVAAARERATEGLLRTVPDADRPDLWPLGRSLLVHVEALARHTAPEDDSEATARLLSWAARLLKEQIVLEPAADHYRRALDGLVAALGDDAQAVLICRSELVEVLVGLGETEQAEELIEALLAGTRRVVGGDDTNTRILRANLATSAYKAGDLDRAETLYERVLADVIRAEGEEDQLALAIRSGLAHVHEGRGDIDRALVMHGRVLDDLLRVRGEDHPETLAARDALGHALESAGQSARAIETLRLNLDEHLRVHGERHPATLVARCHLAEVHLLAGDQERAAVLFRQNLDAAHHLGPDHPQALLARYKLAITYREAGDPRRALPLFEKDLAERCRLYGEDHIEALRSRQFLAAACAEAGQGERARTLHVDNLARLERVLGKDHLETLMSRRHFAQSLLLAGEARTALGQYRRLAADCARVLGPYDPHTLLARTQVAASHFVTGSPARGIALLERVFTDCARDLGTADSRTVKAWEELAGTSAVVATVHAISVANGRSAVRFVARPAPSRGTFR